jgi:hypothetical protein
MKVEINNGVESKFIDVPSIAFGIDINNYGDSSELMYMVEIESKSCDNLDETLKTVPLPKGDWKVIRKL